MPTQVYAVVHDGKGNFIIAIKNQKGYFFHNKKGEGGTILPNGQDLNGGGNWAFPGGELEGTVEEGAKKEFLEETNVDLGKIKYSLAPEAYKNTYKEWIYHGVYFNVGDKLSEIEKIAGQNVDQGTKAADAVMAKKYGKDDYDKLRADFSGCPMDNELDSTDVWNLKEKWSDIQGWKNDSKVGWFYEFLENLGHKL